MEIQSPLLDEKYFRDVGSTTCLEKDFHWTKVVTTPEDSTLVKVLERPKLHSKHHYRKKNGKVKYEHRVSFEILR